MLVTKNTFLVTGGFFLLLFYFSKAISVWGSYLRETKNSARQAT